MLTLRIGMLVATSVALIYSSAARAGDEESLRSNEGPKSTLAPPTVSSDETPAMRRRWYGGQVLVADGAAILAGVGVTLATESRVPLVIGMGGYTLATPIVHLAHGNYWTAAASFGARAGVAAASIAIATQNKSCDRRDDYCGSGRVMGAALFGGLGAILVTVLDSSLLAYETTETPKPPATGLQMAPGFATDGRGFSLGLSGSF